MIIGAIVLLVIAFIVFFIQRRRQEAIPLPTPTATATIEEQEADLEERFRINIPDEFEKANLQDTLGRGYSGLATRNFENNSFDLTVLANLPDPEEGKFYQVWLRRDSETRSMGVMIQGKGGYLLDASVREDLRAFDNVIVSLETTRDTNLEETVLRGSF